LITTYHACNTYILYTFKKIVSESNCYNTLLLSLLVLMLVLFWMKEGMFYVKNDAIQLVLSKLAVPYSIRTLTKVLLKITRCKLIEIDIGRNM